MLSDMRSSGSFILLCFSFLWLSFQPTSIPSFVYLGSVAVGNSIYILDPCKLLNKNRDPLSLLASVRFGSHLTLAPNTALSISRLSLASSPSSPKCLHRLPVPLPFPLPSSSSLSLGFTQFVSFSPWLQSPVLCSCASLSSPTLCSLTPSAPSLRALRTLA